MFPRMDDGFHSLFYLTAACELDELLKSQLELQVAL